MPTAQAEILHTGCRETYGTEFDSFPMTLHIILQPADPNSLVWVTDTAARLGPYDSADMEKIVYLPERKVACSAWGDYSFIIRDELIRWLNDGQIDLTSPAATDRTLHSFIAHFNQDLLPQLRDQPRGHPGAILVTFFDDLPRIHVAKVASFPIVNAVQNLWAGDEDNPAKIFCEYYYAATQQSPEDALTLAIHSMRLAHRLKAFYIGAPNAWLFKAGTLRRLSDSEMATYMGKSEAIDNAIFLSMR
jgi:hypothetical protein